MAGEVALALDRVMAELIERIEKDEWPERPRRKGLLGAIDLALEMIPDTEAEKKVEKRRELRRRAELKQSTSSHYAMQLAADQRAFAASQQQQMLNWHREMFISGRPPEHPLSLGPFHHPLPPEPQGEKCAKCGRRHAIKAKELHGKNEVVWCTKCGYIHSFPGA